VMATLASLFTCIEGKRERARFSTRHFAIRRRREIAGFCWLLKAALRRAIGLAARVGRFRPTHRRTLKRGCSLCAVLRWSVVLFAPSPSLLLLSCACAVVVRAVPLSPPRALLLSSRRPASPASPQAPRVLALVV